MFRWVTTGAVAALCLVVSPVSAEPFDDFINLCVNNDGRREVVIAKAEERGWYRLPAEALPEDGGEFRDTVAFLSVNPEDHPGGMPADLRMVMVGRGDGEKTLGIARLELEACAVVLLADTGEAASWAGRLDQTFGFGATSKGELPLWVFSREGSGFRSEATLMDLSDDQLVAVAKQRDLYIAGVLREEFEGLLFAAIRPGE
ncbi:MAG: hypothetical protein M3Q74_06295 [Pseudomonadota bacterium]|nr:hypothetical protein [Pseudomonadota bacterium]